MKKVAIRIDADDAFGIEDYLGDYFAPDDGDREDYDDRPDHLENVSAAQWNAALDYLTARVKALPKSGRLSFDDTPLNRHLITQTLEADLWAVEGEAEFGGRTDKYRLRRKVKALRLLGSRHVQEFYDWV